MPTGGRETGTMGWVALGTMRSPSGSRDSRGFRRVIAYSSVSGVPHEPSEHPPERGPAGGSGLGPADKDFPIPVMPADGPAVNRILGPRSGEPVSCGGPGTCVSKNAI